MKILTLLNKGIDKENSIVKPYIIAEVGVNHEGSMKTAKRLIDDAKEGGAHAVKFQSYKAETLASKHSPAYWDTTKEPTESQFELFKKHDSFWKDEMQELKDYCNVVGIEFMSTPFDVESAEFLNDMMDVFKISSSDITNKPFIEFICDFGKPILLSTGASNLSEICEAVEWIDDTVPVALLHCILNYPTDDKNAHLGMIKDLQQKFSNKIIGYSDHTLPNHMQVLEMATLLGAAVIEKHFTHDKSLPGNDHYHAMDKEDLKIFKKNIEQMFIILGDQTKYSLPSENPARNNARRSLVTAKNIHKGEIISHEHLTWKRPAHGISPKHIENVLGKKAKRDIEDDEVLQWDSLSK